MADLGTNERRKKVLIERKEKLQNDWKIEQRLKSTIDGLEERKEQLTNESKILKDRADALSSIDFSEKEYADLRLRISALKPVAERSRALRSESGRIPELESRKASLLNIVSTKESDIFSAEKELATIGYSEGDRAKVQSEYDKAFSARESWFVEVSKRASELELNEKRIDDKQTTLYENKGT